MTLKNNYYQFFYIKHKLSSGVINIDHESVLFSEFSVSQISFELGSISKNQSLIFSRSLLYYIKRVLMRVNLIVLP